MKAVDVVLQSFDMIRKDPIVILPYVAFFVIAFVGGILLGLVISPQLSNYPFTQMANQTSLTPAMSQILVSTFISVLPSLVVFCIVVCIIALFFIGVYTSLAKQILAKNKASLGDAFSEAASKFLTVLAIFLIQLIVIMLICGILIAIALFLPLARNSVVFVLGIIGVIILILVEALFFQTYPLVFFEGKGVVESIRKSISLGLKNLWSILGIGVIMLVPLLIIDFLGLIPVIGPLIQLIGSSILVIMAFFMPTLFYYAYVSKPESPETIDKKTGKQLQPLNQKKAYRKKDSSG